MKEIQKIIQKLSREQESAPAAAAAAATQAASATAAAYEPEQKHKVTPGIPGWLNYTACYISGMYSTIRNYMNRLSQSSNLWNAITALILGTPICVIRAWDTFEFRWMSYNATSYCSAKYSLSRDGAIKYLPHELKTSFAVISDAWHCLNPKEWL